MLWAAVLGLSFVIMVMIGVMIGMAFRMMYYEDTLNTISEILVDELDRREPHTRFTLDKNGKLHIFRRVPN